MSPFARAFVLPCLVTIAAGVSFAGGPETRPPGAAAPGQSSVSSAKTPGTVSINVTVDALNNRHAISPYVYGGAYPEDAAAITRSSVKPRPLGLGI
jgi:hypothetical protein